VAVHKRRPQSGGIIQYGQRGLQMRTSKHFGAKNLGFFEIYGVSVLTGRGGGEGELSQCVQGERGQFFTILCGRPLWRLVVLLISA